MTILIYLCIANAFLQTYFDRSTSGEAIECYSCPILTVFINENIARLDIVMQEASLMNGTKRLHYVSGWREHLILDQVADLVALHESLQIAKVFERGNYVDELPVLKRLDQLSYTLRFDLLQLITQRQLSHVINI